LAEIVPLLVRGCPGQSLLRLDHAIRVTGLVRILVGAAGRRDLSLDPCAVLVQVAAVELLEATLQLLLLLQQLLSNTDSLFAVTLFLAELLGQPGDALLHTLAVLLKLGIVVLGGCRSLP
jgi:hypothetical protein